MGPFRTLALLVASLLLASCTGSAGGNHGDRPRAVATYSVIYDLARRIAGDRAEVTSLVPIGTDPHTYEPRPGGIRRLAQVGNGGGSSAADAARGSIMAGGCTWKAAPFAAPVPTGPTT